MHTYRLVIPATLAIAGVLLFAGEAAADDSSGKQRRGPPPVALEACSAAVEGDPCSFEGRRGTTLDGTCESREDKPLACRPDGHGKREQAEPEDAETE